MKKFLFLFITIAIATSSCNSNSESETSTATLSPTTTQSETEETVTTEAPTIEPTVVEVTTEAPPTVIEQEPVSENQDLRIVAAYSNDRYINIIVENISEKTILNYKVAYIEFDANGISVTTENYKNGGVNTANLLPGDKNLSSFYGSRGKYACATVTYMEFSDGETWENHFVDNWAKEVKETFAVQQYEELLAELAPSAALAKINPHVSIESTSKEFTNRFSSLADIKFTLKNIGEKDITRASLWVLQFDSNGYAISTSPYSTYVINDRGVGGTINLAVGEVERYTDNLFLQGNCDKYKIIVATLVFADGTEWTNPYLYEWILVNTKTYIETDSDY